MHAYLIMAHSNENQLAQLIETLDYPENDIYIHLDVKMGDVNIHLLNQAARYSKLKFVERKNVVWGHYSQIDCEFDCFQPLYRVGIMNTFICYPGWIYLFAAKNKFMIIFIGSRKRVCPYRKC